MDRAYEIGLRWLGLILDEWCVLNWITIALVDLV